MCVASANASFGLLSSFPKTCTTGTVKKHVHCIEVWRYILSIECITLLITNNVICLSLYTEVSNKQYYHVYFYEKYPAIF